MGYIIACDFDGTVTRTDTIIAIIKEFAKEKGDPIVRQILNREISINEGVSLLFQLIDSEQKNEVIQFVLESVELRQGFQNLLNFSQEHHIPFYIVSGGMHFFIDPILKQFNGITKVYANDVDFSEQKMKVNWLHTCDEVCDRQTCGTCKPSIVRTINHNKVIAIGDSITDVELAKIADVLFTTDKLTDFAIDSGISHYHFETFDDIQVQLKEVVSG